MSDVEILREQADQAELQFRIADYLAAKASLDSFKAKLALNRLDDEHTRQLSALKPEKSRGWSQRWSALAKAENLRNLARAALQKAEQKERTRNDHKYKAHQNFLATARALWDAIQGGGPK